MSKFDYNKINQAYDLISSYLIKTPLVTSDYINKMTGSKIYFKLENLQLTGSFKFRGATHKISKLTNLEKKNGIIAYSSGNHAQAVAYAAMQRNINAKIVMPSSAPKIKIDNTKKYGAEVIFYDPLKETREEIGEEISLRENRKIIKPYDDYEIIAGQGTAAIEIVDDLNQLKITPDLYVCCCGGGGLTAGTTTYFKSIYHKISAFCVEPEDFDDTKKSLECGERKRNSEHSYSICDALLANEPGELTFEINKILLDGGITVTDREVKDTIIFLAEHLKIICEPGGAVAAAAIINEKINIKNKNVIVMISGGNIDAEMFKILK